MQLPPLIVINLDTAQDREILAAVHRMLEVQHLAFTHLFERLHTMDQALIDLNAKADALDLAVKTESTKVDVLLQGQSDLTAQVADLTAKLAAGTPISAADVAAVSAKLDATLANVNAEVAKINPAAPPVVLPAPTPTPVEPTPPTGP